MPKSDIPFGSEFSPAVVDLPTLLRIVRAREPDRSSMERAINAQFFRGKGAPSDRKTLADNTILSMVQYGILDRTGREVRLSEFGELLEAAAPDQPRLKNLIGEQCLTRLPGLIVISIIRDLKTGGNKLTKLTIARALREQGLHYPENGKHLNVFRQWLQYAGIVNPQMEASGDGLWFPDEGRIRELTGFSQEVMDSVGDLTQAQSDFARAFATMNVDEAKASAVRDAAVALYGTEFPEGGLPQSVLSRLETVSLITSVKTTTGRGAKSHVVRATPLLRSRFSNAVIEQCRLPLGPAFRLLTRTPISSVVAKLGSKDKHEKGIALEALALHICRRLDLTFVKWRLRSAQTGGSEVDIIVEGDRLIFSRWQIQCKNTQALSLDDIAKEVGIATSIRSNVVLGITTGRVGSAVRGFANQVMQTTPIQVVLVSGSDLAELIRDPGYLVQFFNREAASTMKLKRHQLA